MDWTRLVDVYRPGCNEIGVRFETNDGKKRFVKSFKHVGKPVYSYLPTNGH